MPRFKHFFRISAFCLFLFGTVTQIQAQGVLLRGIGAVGESMGGTAIATPIEAGSTIYANPAAIAGIEQCQIGFDLGIIIPQSEVTSGINGIPATWGTSKGDAGQIPAPAMSVLYRECPHSRLTYGLAIAGVGGAVTLYPAMGNGTNPIMQNEARASNVQVFEIMPTVAYKMTDRLAVGFTPVIGLASLSINPMPLGLSAASPMHNFGTRYTWGGGFNLGVYYDFKNNWKTGFTFKSPLWTKSLNFVGTSSVPVPLTPTESEFGINLPLCLGWGLSYSGFKKTIIGLDVRYMDYENTRGFRDVMGPGNTISGLGWDSVMAVSVGMQYTVNDRLKLRAGYCYNTNPIPSESQAYNVSSPMFMQHVLGLGCTITLPKSIDANLAWTHAFENTKTGQFASPGVTGTVINSVYADTIVCGITKRF